MIGTGRRRLPAHLLAIAALLALASTPLPAADPTPSPVETAILERLDALSGEVRSLRLEVQRLRGTVTALRRGNELPAASPVPPAEDVALTLSPDEPARGDADARLVLIEYSDFECPFCARFMRQTLPRLSERYIETGKLRYVYRDFPLAFHANAREAAVAAHCAARQGAFWPMHDRLFANQARLGPPLFREVVKDLGLDAPAFDRCLTDDAVRRRVEDNVASGERLGVRGTPTFFVGRVDNGAVVEVRRIAGAQPYTAFASVIESLLR